VSARHAGTAPRKVNRIGKPVPLRTRSVGNAMGIVSSAFRMNDYADKTISLWRFKMWKRWHNLRCAECRPRYTFWTVQGIPLQQQDR
jgi:hypothetical protein